MFTLYQIAFYADTKSIQSSVNTTYPRCDSHFRDRRGVASLRYRNRAEITVLVCEEKPYPVWFSCWHKSYPVQCERSLT